MGFLLVPADTMPWVGSRDVAVEEETEVGLLRLRCGHGLWLGGDVLGSERRTAGLGDDTVDRAKGRRRQWFEGEVVATAAEQELEVDPDFRDWYRILAEARDAVAEAYGGRIDEGEVGAAPSTAVLPFERAAEQRPPLTGFLRVLAVAASITGIVAASYFAGRVMEQRRFEPRLSFLERQLAELKKPQVSTPWVLEPFETRRGEALDLVLPPGARSAGMLIDARSNRDP